MNDHGRPRDDVTPPALGPQLVGLIVFIVTLWAQETDALAGVFTVAADNLVLAKALALGEGSRLIHLPTQPAAGWTPPLYPLLLSVVWRVWPAFPDNLALVQILDSAMLGAAAWLIAWYARHLEVPRWSAYLAAGLGCVSAPVLLLATGRFGEPVFLLSFSLAIAVADVGRGTGPRAAVGAGLLAGACGVAAPLGVVVLPCVSAVMAWRRSWRDAATAFAAGATILAMWTLSVLGQGGSEMTRAVDTAAVASPLFPVAGVGAFADLMVPPLPAWVSLPIALTVVGVTLWGAVLLFPLAPTLVTGLAAYLGVASAFQGRGASAGAMVPWVAVVFLVGCVRLWGRVPRARIPVAAFVIILAGAYGPRGVGDLAHRRFAAEAQRRSEALGPLIASIRREIPQDAVVASMAADPLYLYTERTVVRLRSGDPDDSWVDALCGAGASHLAALRTPWANETAVDALRAAGVLIRVFELTDGPALYELRCPT